MLKDEYIRTPLAASQRIIDKPCYPRPKPQDQCLNPETQSSCRLRRSCTTRSRNEPHPGVVAAFAFGRRIAIVRRMARGEAVGELSPRSSDSNSLSSGGRATAFAKIVSLSRWTPYTPGRSGEFQRHTAPAVSSANSPHGFSFASVGSAFSLRRGEPVSNRPTVPRRRAIAPPSARRKTPFRCPGRDRAVDAPIPRRTAETPRSSAGSIPSNRR